MLATVLGAGDTPESKTDKAPCPHEAIWACIQFCSRVQHGDGGPRGGRKDCCVPVCPGRWERLHMRRDIGWGLEC